ncbi:MAG: arylsulfatase [Pirellulales bacterium]|nr:arylsulfatase [Pirellulales bacterium]
MIRLLCATLVAICALPTTFAADKPNIIYILLDDAGYGDFSCYGQKKFTTPNIDRMAAEGMKFTDHYAGSTVCAPTRCSLMTGKHTGRCYVRGNREVRPEGQSPIPADTVTIPRLLKHAGYTSGMFGKWGLGAPGSHADPMEHFDRFYGYNCQRQAHTFYPKHLWSDRQKVKLDGKTYSHDLILEEAKKFIRANQKKPFFCYMSITIPHAAMHAPEDEVKPWRKKFPQFENKIGRYSGPLVRNPIAAFAAMMTRMDRGVGEVLDLLRELKIDENTIVMITSDNGPHKEGGHDPQFFDSNGPLKGHKRDLYEGGIRVPLIVRWPGRVKAGSTSDLPSAHWDMLPTFCELSGATTPNSIDGISILPTLVGKPNDQGRHEYLYWEFSPRGGNQAVRWKNWKGIRKNLQKDADAPVELYDLSKDLGEESNVADKHPEIAKKLRGFMDAAHDPSDAFPLLAGKGGKKW